MKRIIRIGMDVHSTNYTLCAMEPVLGDDDRIFANIQVTPDYKNNILFIEELKVKLGINEKYDILCGYEAGCLGYSLYNQLTAVGIRCDILAPTTMLTPQGTRIKTDARDALMIAQCLSYGGYHSVYVPTEEDDSEKENIWTLDSKGELLITIMSSLAQEESRSISENVTWGQRKRMADGKVSFAYSRFLGLEKDKETGKIVVNPEQAETVRLIFRMFLDGMSPHSIARELTSRGIKSPGGKDKWNQQTIRRMLSNEKYKGDALLQKEFTVDFLEKKMKKNEGEVPQYYVEGNHEAIISPAVFDLVQVELAKHTQGGTRYSGVSIFSNKIRCADCGSWYGSKVWHSTDAYKKTIYRCNHKYNGDKCKTPHVTENEVKVAFVSAYNQLVGIKDEIIANTEVIRRTLCVTDALVEEKERLEEDMRVLVEMTQSIVAENARVALNQDDYQKRYDGLVARYDTVKARYDEVVAAIAGKEAQSERLANFIRILKEQDGIIQEFDNSLLGCMVEYVTVGKDKSIVVTFKDGNEIKA